MLIWFPTFFVQHQKVNASIIEIGVFITAVVTMLGLDFLDKVVDIGLAGMIFGELLIGTLLAGVLYLTLPKKVLKYWIWSIPIWTVRLHSRCFQLGTPKS